MATTFDLLPRAGQARAFFFPRVRVRVRACAYIYGFSASGLVLVTVEEETGESMPTIAMSRDALFEALGRTYSKYNLGHFTRV